MITKVSGILDQISGSTVIIENAGLYYELLMPPVMLDELGKTHRKGDSVLLFTYYYIEGGVGVGNLFPRLIGFFDEDDRSFFEIFITVKGLGEKKALQALTMPLEKVADAIENDDKLVLKKLPGIGGRMAEKIIAELKGKLTRFATGLSHSRDSELPAKISSFEQEALDLLMSQLGYRRVEAEQLIRKTLSDEPDISDVEGLIQSIYKLKMQPGNR